MEKEDDTIRQISTANMKHTLQLYTGALQSYNNIINRRDFNIIIRLIIQLS